MEVKSVEEAFDLLKKNKANPRLLNHSVLVLETVNELIDKLGYLKSEMDIDFMRIGAILHDIGKTVYISEIYDTSSNNHEKEGYKILIKLGIDEKIANCCLSHGDYSKLNSSEEIIITLADKLWKGKRDKTLELIAIERISKLLNKDKWDNFIELDEVFESIADKGAGRLLRFKD